MAKRETSTAKKDIPPGKVRTMSGRVLMAPVSGSKLSTREIDRAIDKVRAKTSAASALTQRITGHKKPK